MGIVESEPNRPTREELQNLIASAKHGPVTILGTEERIIYMRMGIISMSTAGV